MINSNYSIESFLRKDLDYRIQRVLMKITPNDANSYWFEEIFDIESVPELYFNKIAGHWVRKEYGILQLGIIKKRVALELSICDEKNQVLSVLNRRQNSEYSSRVIDEEFTSLLSETNIDMSRIQRDIFRSFHRILCLSIPEKYIKWEFSNDNDSCVISSILEEIKNKLKTQFYTEDLLDRFFITPIRDKIEEEIDFFLDHALLISSDRFFEVELPWFDTNQVSSNEFKQLLNELDESILDKNEREILRYAISNIFSFNLNHILDYEMKREFLENYIQEIKHYIFSLIFLEDCKTQRDHYTFLGSETLEDEFETYLMSLNAILSDINEDDDLKELGFTMKIPAVNPLIICGDIFEDFLIDSIKEEEILCPNFFTMLKFCNDYLEGFSTIIKLGRNHKKHLLSYLRTLKKFNSFYPVLIKRNIKFNENCQIRIKFLVPLEKIPCPRKRKIERIKESLFETLDIDKRVWYKSTQEYKLPMGLGGSTHIEITTNNSNISIENNKTSLGLLINNKMIEKDPDDYFDYHYQIKAGEEGNYDIHHYYKTKPINRVFKEGKKPKNIEEYEILLSETYRIKSILANSYRAILFLSVLSLFYFWFLGINIGYLRYFVQISDHKLWIQTSDLVKIFVSYSGLSLSVLAIIVSFRKDHRLILYHTDSTRQFIINVVVLNILILILDLFIISNELIDVFTLQGRYYIILLAPPFLILIYIIWKSLLSSPD